MSHDITCPYCRLVSTYNNTVDADGALNRLECPHCKQKFMATAIIGFSCWEAPCLNGGDHDWDSTTIAPSPYTKMICRHCEEKRVMTIEEARELFRDEPDMLAEWGNS
jgi:hypothetical protein